MHQNRAILHSEKPRIRLGYTVRSPSRSALSEAPPKVTSCGFWQKRVRFSDLLELIWRGVQQYSRSPSLTVLLVLPIHGCGVIPSAGFPAIPESAVKIASE